MEPITPRASAQNDEEEIAKLRHERDVAEARFHSSREVARQTHRAAVEDLERAIELAKKKRELARITTAGDDVDATGRTPLTQLEGRRLLVPLLQVGTIQASGLDGIGALGGLGASRTIASVGPVSFSTTRGASLQATTLSFAPEFDVRLSKSWTLGGILRFGYSDIEYGSGTTRDAVTAYVLSAEPRLGYWVRLTDHFALWPRASTRFGFSSLGGQSQADMLTLGGAADVALVLPLTTNLLVMVVPAVRYDHVAGESATNRVSFGAALNMSLAL
jgi:hypothetical protein